MKSFSMLICGIKKYQKYVSLQNNFPPISTLDVVFIDKIQLITGLNVADVKKPFKSDHYIVNFQLETKVNELHWLNGMLRIFKEADLGGFELL